MRQRLRTLADLERAIGIKRTVPPTFTQRDVENLHGKRMRKVRQKIRGNRPK